MRRTNEGLIDTNWYIVTGAPSSGTTSLVNRLALMGHMTVPEAARAVVDQGISEGRTLEEIRIDESAFQAATARLKEESHASIPPDRLTFWVRGIDGDAMAFWPHSDMPASQEELLNQVSSGPDETIVVRRHRYRGVFICDPLRVQRDYARIEDDQRAVQIDTRLEASYRILGYNPIRVPVAPIEQRAMFILQHIPTKILRHR